MDQNYFSLDDIMALSERVPCKTQLLIPNFGHLDASQESPNLDVGSKLDLPLWLAQSLCKRYIIKVEIPKVFRSSFREILHADATVVDLHKYGPYFYELGLNLLQFGHEETPDIAQALIQTFKSRFRKIMDSAQNFNAENSTLWSQYLDKTEIKLYQASQKALTDFRDWQSRKMERIVRTETVTNEKKRKWSALEDDFSDNQRND